MRTKLLCVVALGLLVMAYADLGAQPEPKKKGGPPDPWFKKQSTETMTRWEYRAVWASDLGDRGAIHEKKLNEYGTQGWELVAINPGPAGQPGMSQFIFRRPLSGAIKIEPKPPVEPAPKEKAAEPKLELRIYLLKNASAQNIANLVDDVTRINKQPIRVVPDPRSNQIIVYASADMHETIEALIQRLDLPADLVPREANVPKAGKKKD